MKILNTVYKAEKLINVSLTYDEENNTIHSIKITGDFFLYPEEKLEILEENLKGTPLKKEIVREKIEQVLKDSEPYGFDIDSLTHAILQCVKGGNDSSNLMK